MRRLLTILSLAYLMPVQGVVELRGEYLYLRPSVCNREYVIADTEPFDVDAFHLQGEVHGVKANYQSGFRVLAGWVDCTTLYNGSGSYTWLHATNEDTTRPSGVDGSLWLTVGFPVFTGIPVMSGDLGGTVGVVEATARALDTLNYDAAELQVGHRSHHDGRFCLRTWGAIHFARIERLRQVFLRGLQAEATPELLLETTVDANARVWGLGPKVGVDFRLALPCQLGLGGSFSAALLAGDRVFSVAELSQSFNSLGVLQDDNNVGYRYPHGLAFFTDLHARLGLNYGVCMRCYTVLVEVGYEWIDYVNALPMMGFANQGLAISTLCQDVRLDGLYVAARLEF